MTILCAGMGEGETPNLIRNGSFVQSPHGWFSANKASGVTYQAGQGRNGGGAIEIASNARADYRPSGIVVPLGALSSYDLISFVRASALPMNAAFNVAFLSDEFGTTLVSEAGASDTVDVAEVWQEISLLAANVPEGATHARIQLLHTGGAGLTMRGSDLYFGPAGAAVPPYPSAAVLHFPANRILNGSFETHILGWAGWWGTETLARNTATPITGVGSLNVTTLGGGEEEGAFYGWPDYSHNLIVVPGEPLRLTFRAKGAGEIKARMAYNGASPVDAWVGTLSGTPQLVSVDLTVPAGAWSVLPLFATTTAQAVTFTIDDIALGTP